VKTTGQDPGDDFLRPAAPSRLWLSMAAFANGSRRYRTTMSTRAFSLVASMALVLVVVACGGGSTTTSALGNGSEPGSASSSTDPTGSTDSTGPTPTSGALGAACTKYVACCGMIATTAPQLAASCDAVQDAVRQSHRERRVGE
jgi:hypothetical protein